MIIITPKSETLRELIARSTPTEVIKTAPTMAREILDHEMDLCFVSPHKANETPVPGHVWTREGLVPFHPGQMLCRGVENELWPMEKVEFSATKMRHPDHPNDNADGWGIYLNIGFAFAIEMTEPFKVQIYDGSFIDGAVGDFLLYKPDYSSTWAVGPTIYEKSWLPTS